MSFEQPATGFALSTQVVTPQNLVVGIAYALSPKTVMDKIAGSPTHRTGEHFMQVISLLMRIAAGERVEVTEQAQLENVRRANHSIYDAPLHFWWFHGQLWMYAFDTFFDRREDEATDEEEAAYVAVYRYSGSVLGIPDDQLAGTCEDVQARLDNTTDAWAEAGNIVDQRSPELFWRMMSDGPLANALGAPPLGTIMELLRRHMLAEEYELFEAEYNRLVAADSN